MERTVPSTASEEVELYLRTYYSLLRSSTDVQIRTLEEVHAGMNSLLHPNARQQSPDMGAFLYSLLRLPTCIHRVQVVVLGQGLEVFQRGGYGNIEEWEPVNAPARRRRCFFDGQATLACYIASRTDIDDIIPMLTAFQIEWNKIHYLLRQQKITFDEHQRVQDTLTNLAEVLHIGFDDLLRLQTVWDENLFENLNQIAQSTRNLRVRLLSGSLREYRRATNIWWDNIERHLPDMQNRPVYFVSSNTHSLVNLLTGFALRHKKTLVNYLTCCEDPELVQEWQDIQTSRTASSLENLLYYLLRRYQVSSEGRGSIERQRAQEVESGIRRVPAEHSFDIEAQVIEINRLQKGWLDSRLMQSGFDRLIKSNALILNIDYPLGLAAYDILSKIAEQVDRVLGIYVMGKSAALNSIVGDVMIPNVVHDEHSRNSYLFPNCFVSADVVPFLVYGTALDNQKAVTVRGTFLQNKNYMDVFYREGYADIEMEAGPYLSAAYEMYRPTRHPINEIVNLYGVPFDIGIIHYVSDTPLNKGKNLGAGKSSYFGMDSTYAASVAVLRRIIHNEINRLSTS